MQDRKSSNSTNDTGETSTDYPGKDAVDLYLEEYLLLDDLLMETGIHIGEQHECRES